eukprot:g7869.t1
MRRKNGRKKRGKVAKKNRQVRRRGRRKGKRVTDMLGRFALNRYMLGRFPLNRYYKSKRPRDEGRNYARGAKGLCEIVPNVPKNVMAKRGRHLVFGDCRQACQECGSCQCTFKGIPMAESSSEATYINYIGDKNPDGSYTRASGLKLLAGEEAEANEIYDRLKASGQHKQAALFGKKQHAVIGKCKYSSAAFLELGVASPACPGNQCHNAGHGKCCPPTNDRWTDGDAEYGICAHVEGGQCKSKHAQNSCSEGKWKHGNECERPDIPFEVQCCIPNKMSDADLSCLEKYDKYIRNSECGPFCKFRFLVGQSKLCPTPWDDNNYLKFLRECFPDLRQMPEKQKEYFEFITKKLGVDKAKRYYDHLVKWYKELKVRMATWSGTNINKLKAKLPISKFNLLNHIKDNKAVKIAGENLLKFYQLGSVVLTTSRRLPGETRSEAQIRKGYAVTKALTSLVISELLAKGASLLCQVVAAKASFGILAAISAPKCNALGNIVLMRVGVWIENGYHAKEARMYLSRVLNNQAIIVPGLFRKGMRQAYNDENKKVKCIWKSARLSRFEVCNGEKFVYKTEAECDRLIDTRKAMMRKNVKRWMNIYSGDFCRKIYAFGYDAFLYSKSRHLYKDGKRVCHSAAEEALKCRELKIQQEKYLQQNYKTSICEHTYSVEDCNRGPNCLSIQKKVRIKTVKMTKAQCDTEKMKRIKDAKEGKHCRGDEEQRVKCNLYRDYHTGRRDCYDGEFKMDLKLLDLLYPKSSMIKIMDSGFRELFRKRLIKKDLTKIECMNLIEKLKKEADTYAHGAVRDMKETDVNIACNRRYKKQSVEWRYCFHAFNRAKLDYMQKEDIDNNHIHGYRQEIILCWEKWNKECNVLQKRLKEKFGIHLGRTETPCLKVKDSYYAKGKRWVRDLNSCMRTWSCVVQGKTDPNAVTCKCKSPGGKGHICKGKSQCQRCKKFPNCGGHACVSKFMEWKPKNPVEQF